MSWSGPILAWDSRKCTKCGEFKYSYLRAFTLFTKRGKLWRMPSTSAKKVDGTWCGWSNLSQEFDDPLWPTPRKPLVLCTCAGVGGRLTRRIVLASVAKQQQRIKHIQEIRRRQLLSNKEHNGNIRYVPGNFDGKAKRNNIGTAGPHIGGFRTIFEQDEGENRYGIERGGIDRDGVDAFL